jgi:hypothetical protein
MSCLHLLSTHTSSERGERVSVGEENERRRETVFTMSDTAVNDDKFHAAQKEIHFEISISLRVTFPGDGKCEI